MIEQITRLTEKYHHWVRQSTTLREIENAVEITTPFLDRHNDMMQVYAELSGDDIILTDAGYTIEDLEFCGLSMKSERFRNLMQINLNGFGVERAGNDLVARATAKDFGVKLHNLLQAMIAVDDLHYVATPSNVKQRFEAEIGTWLHASKIRFDAAKFKGKLGYYVNYKYVIPPSDNKPHRMLIGINSPGRSAVEQVAIRWLDIRESRPSDARLYAILRDEQSENVTIEADALRSYEIDPVLWSQRESVREELAA